MASIELFYVLMNIHTEIRRTITEEMMIQNKMNNHRMDTRKTEFTSGINNSNDIQELSIQL